LYEPEFLRYDKGVIADRESGVTKSLTHLGRVPELLMDGPPFPDRGISFAFAQRVVQVHIGQAYHPHRGRLDNRDRAASGVDHNLAQSGARQWILLVLVVGDQPGRRGLLTRQDRGDELIAQRSRESGLRDWQILGGHGGKPTDPAIAWNPPTPCPDCGSAARRRSALPTMGSAFGGPPDRYSKIVFLAAIVQLMAGLFRQQRSGGCIDLKGLCDGA